MVNYLTVARKLLWVWEETQINGWRFWEKLESDAFSNKWSAERHFGGLSNKTEMMTGCPTRDVKRCSFFPMTRNKTVGRSQRAGVGLENILSKDVPGTTSEIISYLGLYFFSPLATWIPTDNIIFKNQLGYGKNLSNNGISFPASALPSNRGFSCYGGKGESLYRWEETAGHIDGKKKMNILTLNSKHSVTCIIVDCQIFFAFRH